MNLDYGVVYAKLYVARDREGLLLGTWPAEGANTPQNILQTVADTLATVPGIRRRMPASLTREEHWVDRETGALVTAGDS